MTKICSRCKDEKPIIDFSKCKNNNDGLQWYCKECMKETKRKTRYGIDPDEYNQMYVDQEGKCYICERDESEFNYSLHVDHCHRTGDVRKLLCVNCNRGIGYFYDDINLLEKVVSYLKEHNDKI